MTILFDPSLRNLFIGHGIKEIMASSVGITVYKGTQPNASDIIAAWTNYNSASTDYLVHYAGAVWSQPLNGILYQLTTIPAAVTPIQSGAAAWCILWSTNILQAQIDGITLPHANFIVGPVTDSVGNGMIRFDDTLLTNSTAIAPVAGSITAYFA